MRHSDIFTVTFVASVGVLLTFIACSFLLGDPDTRYLKHKTIGKITADLTSPDPEVFNVDAINPTVEVYVGSCEDVDRNGILDRAELVACGRATPETAAEEEKKEKAEEKKKEETEKTSDDENEDSKTKANSDKTSEDENKSKNEASDKTSGNSSTSTNQTSETKKEN
jgi:singapore isolate B (sub-type 7) whole genome shotgun sequence assembly, scaffold_11